MSEKTLMEEIMNFRLPGFYLDSRGAYGIVLGSVYICCFVNEDRQYDVTVDTVDENGDFYLNLEWESYPDAQSTVQSLRTMVKRYCPRCGQGAKVHKIQ